MAKDFLGNEIKVGDLVCYVDYTKTRSWLDIARISKINSSSVTLEYVDGLTKANERKFKHSFYDSRTWEIKGYKYGRIKNFDKIVKYGQIQEIMVIKKKDISIQDLKQRAKYLSISAEDPYYEVEFNLNPNDSIYAALSNKSHTGVTFKVDLESHKIVSHTKVPDGNLFMKVVDTGVYTLLDEDETVLAELSGYIPNKAIPPSNGYGDYLDITVKNNVIVNWYDEPDFSEFI